MGNTFFGIFMLLHGLVHIWYIVLSRQWVAFTPEMGYSGQSWLLSKPLGDGSTRLLASLLYGLSTVVMVIAAISILCNGGWMRPWLIIGSICSAMTILICWDGSFERIIEKGLIGFLINIVSIGLALGNSWL
ncbi:MAG: hypothetical protein JEZ00_18340 [Anaerolineaceae bacterium]|nr:hypothetical protein [Anaerolineaceae bacterium]